MNQLAIARIIARQNTVGLFQNIETIAIFFSMHLKSELLIQVWTRSIATKLSLCLVIARIALIV